MSLYGYRFCDKIPVMSTSTITLDQIYQEIQQLPAEGLPEVATFIKFLRFKLVAEEAQSTQSKVVVHPDQKHEPALSFHVHPQQALMEHEVEAFESQHAQLWKRYANHYVAMQGGQVVDSDLDELALLERIETTYPEQIVLIRQVTELLPSDLVFRSPRFTI